MEIKSAMGHRGTLDKNDNRILQSIGGDSRRVAALKLYGNALGLFRYDSSTATRMEEITKEIKPELKVETYIPSVQKQAEDGIVKKFHLTMPDGTVAHVTEKDDNTLFVDASELNSWESMGTLLYHVLATYALNNDKVFIGDPNAFSRDAFYRRTQNMASSVVRYGTTRHLRPHPDQGIPWGNDDSKNFENLITKATQNIIGLVKDLDGVDYEFQTRTFRTKSAGAEFTDADFERVNEGTEAKTAKSGSASLKRGTFFRSLSREASSDEGWQRILASVDCELSDGGHGGALEGTGY